MATRQRKQSRLKRFVMPVITIAFLTYFGYHALHGEYGLVGRVRLERQAIQLEDELRVLNDRRDQLQRRVNLLKPDSLDQDMLDERARLNLNLAHRNEITIFLDPHTPSKNN